MNLEQITKNYEEYKEGLNQALHKLDDYKQKCNEEFLLLKAEMLKSPEKIQEESRQSIDEWKKDFEELRSSILFPITCVLPLQTIIAHYLVKNSVPFLNEEVDLIIKTKNPSVRDIYKTFKQLPENVTVSIFNNIGIGFIIDAFRDGEDCFYVKFESLENKSEILDELYFIAKTFELGSNVEQLFDINDENTLEAVKFYIQEYKDSVKAHPEYKNTNAFCEAFDPNQFVQVDHKTSRISVDLNRSLDYYKQLLMKYIELSPRFDSYTKKCADKVLQNPDYIDITNELFEECEAEITKESDETMKLESQGGADEKPQKRGNGKIEKPFPLAFPNHIGITEKETQLKFLDKLYKTLIENKFVSNDTRLDVFQYLLGGGNKPNDYKDERIIWNNDLSHVQIFYVCYYGIPVPNENGNYDWEPLKKIFSIEGKKNISSNAKKNVENRRYSQYFETFKDYITIAKPI